MKIIENFKKKPEEVQNALKIFKKNKNIDFFNEKISNIFKI